MEGTKVMKSKGIDGAALRIIAMLTLLIDHIGWFFLKDLLPDRHDRRQTTIADTSSFLDISSLM